MVIRIALALLIIVASFMSVTTRRAHAAETTIELMPVHLETRFALSAVPSALRDKATVYLLDPKRGYQLSKQGTSGVACLVARIVPASSST